jgi:hypothetical protein
MWAVAHACACAVLVVCIFAYRAPCGDGELAVGGDRHCGKDSMPINIAREQRLRGLA